MIRRAIGVVALLTSALLVAVCGTSSSTVDGDLAAAISAAEPGAVLELAPGRYSGPVVINKPLTLIGVQGAVIEAPDDVPAVTVLDTSEVTLRGLRIEGGKSGILVRRSLGVVIEEVTVVAALWHGILAQDSEVVITQCLITRLRAPTPQGIEIINSDRRPPSLVRGCRIEGPVFEGVVAHVSHVTFEDNEVVGSTGRGIIITEMSEGRMEGNRVVDARGSAYFCGDMSNCAIIDNVVDGIAPGQKHRSAQGHGVVVHYHSHAYVDGLDASGVQGELVLLMLGSALLDKPPYP